MHLEVIPAQLQHERKQQIDPLPEVNRPKKFERQLAAFYLLLYCINSK